MTQRLLNELQTGTADLSQITVEEWLQVAFIHAMSNGIIHLEQRVVYGGNLFNVHMCMDQVGPAGGTLADAMTSTQ